MKKFILLFVVVFFCLMVNAKRISQEVSMAFVDEYGQSWDFINHLKVNSEYWPYVELSDDGTMRLYYWVGWDVGKDDDFDLMYVQFPIDGFKYIEQREPENDYFAIGDYSIRLFYDEEQVNSETNDTTFIEKNYCIHSSNFVRITFGNPYGRDFSVLETKGLGQDSILIPDHLMSRYYEIEYHTSSMVENITAEQNVYVADGFLNIKSSLPIGDVFIYDMTERLLDTIPCLENILVEPLDLPKGIYVIKTRYGTFKVVT